MSPFTVLHVCMGNICRSPMAERLLVASVTAAATEAGLPPTAAGELVHSHSVGTGGWHAGGPMDPAAAEQVSARGGDPVGFTARKLLAGHLDSADLVLVATADQQEYVIELRPDAAERTFVLGQFGRLLRLLQEEQLPPPVPTPQGVQVRGEALVATASAARAGAPALPGDDLADPYGLGEQAFVQVADEIEETLRPLAAALLAPIKN